MKKFMSILLTLSLIAGTSMVAFAEGNDATGTAQTTTSKQTTALTSEQQQARDAYLKIHFEDMNQLVTLRQQTETARDANNADAKQIKDTLKEKTTLNNDSVSKLKALASQRKTLTEQAKQLHQKRLPLKTQYKDAVKAKDVEKMKTIEQQILDLNKQVSDLKVKDDAIKAQILPLKDQLQGIKDANKKLRDDVKNKLEQAKTIRVTIKIQGEEKAKLWVTYKENIKNKDYTTASITFKAIIAKKSAMLNNIKQRGTILKQVLTSLN